MGLQHCITDVYLQWTIDIANVVKVYVRMLDTTW